MCYPGSIIYLSKVPQNYLPSTYAYQFELQPSRSILFLYLLLFIYIFAFIIIQSIHIHIRSISNLLHNNMTVSRVHSATLTYANSNFWGNFNLFSELFIGEIRGGFGG
jgi:hypothetical protein